MTYTQQEVLGDTAHLLPLVHPVDVYVEMRNDADILQYDALRGNTNSVDTVARATRVDDSTFNLLSMDENGVMYNRSQETFMTGETKMVALRDSSMQDVGFYVPMVYAYTDSYMNSKDTTVVSTYGANNLSDYMGLLSMSVTAVEKSANTFYNRMAYTAEITLHASIPVVATDLHPYYYRIWRVLPDGTEELLDTIPYQQWSSTYINEFGQEVTVTGERSYEVLKSFYPGEDITLRDIFFYYPISGNQTLNVDYIARMYTTDIPANSQGLRADAGRGYGIAPAGGSGSWGPSTPTSIMEFSSAADVVNTTYYNLLGMSSSTPFKGINIVIRNLSDGTTVVEKRLY